MKTTFRPLPFSTLMVQALFAGTKTQTRRLVKPQPIIDADSGYVYDGKHKTCYKNDCHHPDWRIAFAKEHSPIKVGDIIWGRETFREYWIDDVDNVQIDYKADNNHVPILQHDGDGFQMYKADGSERYIPWKPGMFMPKEACRLWLNVTDVRIELLNDISEKDALAEGIIHQWIDSTTMTFTAMDYQTKQMRYDFTAKDSYKSLWDSINGKGAFSANPFVWVYSFDILHTRPEGFIK